MTEEKLWPKAQMTTDEKLDLLRKDSKEISRLLRALESRDWQLEGAIFGVQAAAALSIEVLARGGPGMKRAIQQRIDSFDEAQMLEIPNLELIERWFNCLEELVDGRVLRLADIPRP